MKDVVDIKKWMELSIPRTMSTAWAEEAPHYPPPTPGCLGPGPESPYRHPQPRDGVIQQQRAGGYEDEGGLGRSSRLRDGLPPCWGEESPASLRGHPWRHRAQWKRGSAVRIRRLVKNLELYVALMYQKRWFVWGWWRPSPAWLVMFKRECFRDLFGVEGDNNSGLGRETSMVVETHGR